MLPLINPHSIELDSSTSTVFLKQKGMKIDLGCLAKGYSADKVAQFLREEGVTSALINLGGNVLTLEKIRQEEISLGKSGFKTQPILGEIT